MSARMSPARTIAAHAALITYTLIALFPVFVIVINSFKSRKAIFSDPLALPTWRARLTFWRALVLVRMLRRQRVCGVDLRAWAISKTCVFDCVSQPANCTTEVRHARVRGVLFLPKNDR